MTCPRCGQDRTPEQFVSATGRATRSCAACRERGRSVNRRHRQAIGSSGRRADNLRQKYGITPSEYDALRAGQDYRCAICGIPERDLKATAVGRPRVVFRTDEHGQRLERRPALTRLRILDSRSSGTPAQTFRFRGAVTVLIDGYEIHIPEGSSRTVVSPTGLFELLTGTHPGDDGDPPRRPAAPA